MWECQKQTGRVSILHLALILLTWSSISFGEIGDWRKFYDAGLSAYKANYYDKAETQFKKSLDVAEDEFSRSKYHSQSLYQLGLTLHKLGKTNKGIRFMEKAHKYMSKAEGKDSDQALEQLEGIADVRLESGRPQYAESIFRILLKLRTKKLGAHNKVVVATRIRLAKTLAMLDKNEEAVELIETSLKDIKRDGTNDKYLAGVYEVYSKLLKKIGEPKKAKKFKDKAMELRSTAKAQSVLDASKDDNTFKLVTTAGEYKEPPGFLKFKSTMINKSYNFSEEYMHSLCKNKKLFTLVHHCIVYWFKSSLRTHDGVHPMAILKVIEYATPDSAQEAYKNIKSSVNPNTGLNYEWNYLVVNGSHMYWLSAMCAFSKAKWNQVLTDFKTSFTVTDDGNLSKLNCKCGGGCK